MTQLNPTLGRAVALARRIISPIRYASLASAVAAAGLIVFLCFGVGFDGWLRALATMTLTILLLAPPIVLILFHQALEQIIDLPANLTEAFAGGRGHAGTLRSLGKKTGDSLEVTSEPRPFVLLRSVYDLGRLMMETKGLLIESVMLVRLLNPITLLIVLASLVATLASWGLLIAVLAVTVW